LQTDTFLLQSLKKGNTNALALLYERHADKVYNVALSFSKNIQDAEEIVQDVFLKIHNKAHLFQENSTLATWIYRITVNTALSHLEKSKRHSNMHALSHSSHSVHFEHPGVLLERKEEAELLFKVIDTLPPRQRMAFVLAQVEGLNQKEVAAAMDLSVKAIESLLQRAKTKLREELKKHLPERRNFKK
jgi:RNA polymerase sigma factor (sigma-70 family)